MKAYRKPELTLPEPFEPVLVHNDESGIAYIAYYDDGYWFEAHTQDNKSTAFVTGCPYPFYHTNNYAKPR